MALSSNSDDVLRDLLAETVCERGNLQALHADVRLLMTLLDAVLSAVERIASALEVERNARSEVRR